MNKFIITDPYLIMDRERYRAAENDYWDFKKQSKLGELVPFNTCYKKNQIENIIIYRLEATPNGNTGEFHVNNDITLKVEKFMMCIAENRLGWNEKYGITFETLEEAKDAFPKIIKNY